MKSIETMTNEELLLAIADICEELGWSIAVPKGDEDVPVQGLIIGEYEYIEGILNKIDPVIDYEEVPDDNLKN